jgi:hypothetical protein
MANHVPAKTAVCGRPREKLIFGGFGSFVGGGVA